MKPFIRVTGVAVPFLEDDVNTDQIAPVGGGAKLGEDYAQTFFRHRRRLADGSEDPNFVFNQPQFKNPAILVAGKNFGCGSSRESAVWALQAIGVSCVVARSLADIYRENCLQNGVLPITLPDEAADRMEKAALDANGAQPFTVDLEARAISGPNGLALTFEISDSDRTRLLEGLDDIGLTMKHLDQIKAFEQKALEETPWAQRADIHVVRG
jgi:3-isopropylmalate/(R)-2-methylmalate dehydratase small subunit